MARRPKLVVNNSFLSARPSPLVSVYFQTSLLLDSIVRIAFAPYGTTKRGNTRLSTNTVCVSYTPSLSLSSQREMRLTGASWFVASASSMYVRSSRTNMRPLPSNDRDAGCWMAGSLNTGSRW